MRTTAGDTQMQNVGQKSWEKIQAGNRLENNCNDDAE